MCTVSVISTGAIDRAVRIVCNRDELRTRPVALPPIERQFGQCRTIMPIDPVSGGTWIAVSDAGLMMALLNQTLTSGVPRSAAAPSRGLIIPSLAGAGDFDDALAMAGQIDPNRFQPFRLLLFSAVEYSEVSSDGRRISARRSRLTGDPLMFTSSGLGDALVQQPRQELFEQIFGRTRGTPARQDAFHSHRWPQRGHLSVNMSRADARTVSRTVVELNRDRARLVYVPLEADAAAPPVAIDLSLRVLLPC